jgi:hypothetical protein
MQAFDRIPGAKIVEAMLKAADRLENDKDRIDFYFCVRWVADFLEDRMRRARVGEAHSSYRIHNCGTPQGTIIGPL